MNLRALIKKGRTFTPPNYAEEAAQATRRLVLDRRTILLNCQSVADDVLTGSLLPRQALEELNRLAHPVPPFPAMWTEFRGPDGALSGALVMRMSPRWFLENMHVGDGVRIDPERLQFAVSCFFFTEYNGEAAGPYGEIAYCISKENGDVAGPVLFRKKKDDPTKGDWFALCLLVIGHSLARLNCRNVALRAISSSKVASRQKRDLVPATVWHEIRVTNVPQIRAAGRAAFGQDESKMRRFWVRGHYADCRNGAGLFGNPNLRCVFWIPEHQRGNAELGDVIPEYKLA